MQLYQNNLVTVYQMHTSVTSEIKDLCCERSVIRAFGYEPQFFLRDAYVMFVDACHL